jgi:hypothetical protein
MMAQVMLVNFFSGEKIPPETRPGYRGKGPAIGPALGNLGPSPNLLKNFNSDAFVRH